MDKKTVGYWLATAVIVLVIGGGGVVDILQPQDLVVIIDHLGFPHYAFTIIGIFKVGGAVVVAAPGMKRLKEWAHAGITIDLVGAAWAHVAVGDGVGDILAPLVFLAINLASWALRPDSRRL